jgi:hypothetical protein
MLTRPRARAGATRRSHEDKPAIRSRRPRSSPTTILSRRAGTSGAVVPGRTAVRLCI